MNYPKTEPVSVGYGYVRIDPKLHGPKLPTDEYLDACGYWVRVGPDCQGEFLDVLRYRRRIDPGEGWELVPEGTQRTLEMEHTFDGISWHTTIGIASGFSTVEARSDGAIAFRRRVPATGTWFISCELPRDQFHNEQSACDEAKHRALEYGGKFTVFHAVRAFERIEPVAAQVREVQI